MAQGKEHVPNDLLRGQVETMAGLGIPEDDIAQILVIDPKTLRKHYRAQLDTGHIKANSKVAANLFRIATGEGREAITAAIFWLKCRAGWSEYAPPPPPNKPAKLGKKDQAIQDAKNAGRGSAWGDLVH